MKTHHPPIPLGKCGPVYRPDLQPSDISPDAPAELANLVQHWLQAREACARATGAARQQRAERTLERVMARMVAAVAAAGRPLRWRLDPVAPIYLWVDPPGATEERA